MSHSPTAHSGSDEVLLYDKGWAAVNRMLRQGRSFSGREKNCAFLNLRGAKDQRVAERFACVSSATALDFDDDARGLALCDWDRDGRVDMWVSNRTSPRLRLLRNAWPTAEKGWVQFKLTGDGKSTARDAYGARIEVRRAGQQEKPLVKTVYGGSGYLSQSSPWTHFGLGEGAGDLEVTVKWPAGQSERFVGVKAGGFYQLKQQAGKAEAWTPPARAKSEKDLVATVQSRVPLESSARVIVLKPLPLPEELGLKITKPTLLSVFATWCENCQEEIKTWSKSGKALAGTGLQRQMLCLDEDGTQAKAETATAALRKACPIVQVKQVGPQVPLLLNLLQRTVIGRQEDLPLPTNFLVDATGSVRVVYKGLLDPAQIAADAKLIKASPSERLAAALPEPGGQWLEPPQGVAPRSYAVMMVDNGQRDSAERYLNQILPFYSTDSGSSAPSDKPEENFRLNERFECHVFLGALAQDKKAWDKAVSHYSECLKIDPESRKAHLELIRIYAQQERWADQAKSIEVVLKAKRDDPEMLSLLARAKQKMGQHTETLSLLREALTYRPSADLFQQLGTAHLLHKEPKAALEAWQKALSLDSRHIPSANNLAWLLATSMDDTLRNGQEAIRLAESAAELTRRQSPAILSTLAAAYAESARFDDAQKALSEALTLAESAKDAALISRLKARSAQFAKGSPVRE